MKKIEANPDVCVKVWYDDVLQALPNSDQRLKVALNNVTLFQVEVKP